MNGSLSGTVSKALCQGSTFSLACHESEAGSGGCVRGCVRQQVQLGLPRQEVGRACVSYLIYGRAAGTLPARANEKRKEQEGKGGGQLPLHPKCWDFSGVQFLPRHFVYRFAGDKVKRNGVRASDKRLYLGSVIFKAAWSH